MGELEAIRNLLINSPFVQADAVRVSYIEKLMPNLKGQPYIILYKKDNKIKAPMYGTPTSDETSPTSEFDLTGSPLKYSFNKLNFVLDDTLIIPKRNWQKTDESYLPLSQSEASASLTLCLEHFNTNCFSPILALCDAEDDNKTRIIGIIVQDKWFTTIQACSMGAKTCFLTSEYHTLLKQHQSMSFTQEHEVEISTFSVFNLCGSPYEMYDWSENTKCNFNGYVCMEVTGNELAMNLPTNKSKNRLVMQIVTGGEMSLLKKLWQQLCLLHEYLLIIENFKKEPAENAVIFSSFTSDTTKFFKKDAHEIQQNLEYLLNGDYTFRNFNATNCITNKESMNHEVPLDQYVQNVFNRHNLDFIDILWELLIGTSNYTEMTDCIHKVLKKFTTDDRQPVILRNTSRFASVLSDLCKSKMSFYWLTGILPLELILDMGFSKLSRDYTYILMNARLIELHDLQCIFTDVSSGEFSIDRYRKKLLAMTQIHICLEFMLLIQIQLHWPLESMQLLFTQIWKEFILQNPTKDLVHFLHNTVLNVSIPISNVFTDKLTVRNPTSWRIVMLSESALTKVRTITYSSQISIFPTYVQDSDIATEEEEIYDNVKVVLLSRRIKGNLKQ